MNNPPRATFNKPEKVIFDPYHMKPGTYHVEGPLTEAWWADLCKQLGLPPVGEGHVRLDFEFRPPLVMVRGSLDTAFERECVRSLEPFMQSTTMMVDEVLAIGALADDEQAQHIIPLEADVLDVGDFIRQQITIGLDPYPVKGAGPRGGILVSDGLDEMVAEEKNPFSVLKKLKS